MSDDGDDPVRWWGEPLDARRFHVFEGTGGFPQSLCGNWAMGHKEYRDDVDPESDTYREGKDCKECCRRAGVLEGSDQ